MHLISVLQNALEAEVGIAVVPEEKGAFKRAIYKQRLDCQKKGNHSFDCLSVYDPGTDTPEVWIVRHDAMEQFRQQRAQENALPDIDLSDLGK